MPSVTIVGAGVFGLSIAYSLPRSYDVTIVAKDLPGDYDSHGWASPWAGAGFGGGTTKPGDPVEIEMLKTSFRHFWELAEFEPESSVKKIEDVTYRDNTDTDEDIWWKNFMPNYRILDPSEYPPSSNAKIAISITSIVLTPTIYLSYLKSKLASYPNVRFSRRTITHLRELTGSCNVIINATGVGSQTLGGVEDPEVEPIRGQTLLVRVPGVKRMSLRTGNDYCYVIPRGDGTAILGGIKDHGSTDNKVDPAQREDVVRRAHQIEPLIPEDVAKLDIVKDIVGFRPGRKSGMRVESEFFEGQPVVHAYGAGGTGFAFSAGVGRHVAKLVDELIYGDKGPVPRSGPIEEVAVNRKREGRGQCVKWAKSHRMRCRLIPLC